MSQTILVTGGTGTLGKLVVPRLLAAGADVRVLSRRPRPNEEGITYLTGDLTTGEGVAAAALGADVIVHCAGASKGDEDKARVLVEAARQAGTNHLVYISVVGADRVPQVSRIDRTLFGYFGMKRGAEQVIEASGIPWTTLRASQFHDLILAVARGMAKLPALPMPTGVRFQPVDAADVADRLAALALGSPAGLVPDLAGPQIFSTAELVRSYLKAVGKRRPMVPLYLPGRAARATRAGANVAPDHADGKRTWAEFLAAKVG